MCALQAGICAAVGLAACLPFLWGSDAGAWRALLVVALAAGGFHAARLVLLEESHQARALCVRMRRPKTS